MESMSCERLLLVIKNSVGGRGGSDDFKLKSILNTNSNQIMVKCGLTQILVDIARYCDYNQ